MATTIKLNDDEPQLKLLIVAIVCLIAVQFTKGNVIIGCILGGVALICMGVIIYKQFKEL